MENQTIQPNQSSATNHPSVTPPPNSNKGLLIGLIVLLAIIAAGMGGYLLRGEPESNSSVSKQESATAEEALTTSGSRAEDIDSASEETDSASIEELARIERESVEKATRQILEVNQIAWGTYGFSQIRESDFGGWRKLDLSLRIPEDWRFERAAQATDDCDAYVISDPDEIVWLFLDECNQFGSQSREAIWRDDYSVLAQQNSMGVTPFLDLRVRSSLPEAPESPFDNFWSEYTPGATAGEGLGAYEYFTASFWPLLSSSSGDAVVAPTLEEIDLNNLDNADLSPVLHVHLTEEEQLAARRHVDWMGTSAIALIGETPQSEFYLEIIDEIVASMELAAEFRD